MAFQVADRVKETSTTTGTGTLDLGGAPDTYETFVAGIGNGNTTYYSIANRAANEWEVGIGTVTDAATDTLSRDIVISSSNSDNLVNFSAGTKDVICTLPADRSFVIDDEANVSVTANVTATAFSGDGSSLTALNISTDSTPELGGDLSTNGNDINFGDNDKAQFGDSNDFTIQHINNTTIDNETGSIFIRQFADDEDIVIQNDDGAGGVTNYIVVDGSAETTFFSKDTRHQDNVKAKFGTASDLHIYHDGVNSYISDVGTGNLRLTTDGTSIEMKSSGEDMAKFFPNGSVDLYYDNSKKFETTSTGIDVTGTVVSDGLTVDTDTLYVDSANNRVGVGTDSPSTKFHIANGSSGASPAVGANFFLESSGDTQLCISSPNANTSQIRFGSPSDASGAIIAYDDTQNVFSLGGSSTNTFLKFVTGGASVERMRIDSSGNVGIGTSSPSQLLSLFANNTTDTQLIIEQDSTGDAGIQFSLTGVKNWTVGVDNSDSDKFKIENGSTIGSSDDFVIDSSGKVGIGTSSPQGVLTLTKGTLSGQTAATDTNDLVLDGATDVGISFLTNNTGNGRIRFGDTDSTSSGLILYHHTNDFLRLDTAGSEAMRIDSSGNVGIGTSSPNVPLDVIGAIRTGIDSTHYGQLSGLSSALYIGHRDDTADGTIIFGGYGGGSFTEYARFNPNGKLNIDNDFAVDTDTLYVDSANNRVGIGTSSPVNGKLVVIQSTDAQTGGININNTGGNSFYLWQDGSGNTNLDSAGAGSQLFKTANTERMRIDSGGNVGIGTSSPDATLHLQNSSETARVRFDDSVSPRNNFVGLLGDADQLAISADETNLGLDSHIAFRIDADEKMRITSSGLVGIGTDSPSYNLDIQGDTPTARILHNATTTVTTTLKIHGNRTGTGGEVANLEFINTQSSSAGDIGREHAVNSIQTWYESDAVMNMRFGVGGGEKMRIMGDGKVGIGTTSPSTQLEVDGKVTADNVNSAILTVAIGKFNSDGTTSKASGISCSKTATGEYSISFSTARSDANYTVIGQVIESSATLDDVIIQVMDGTQATTGFDVKIHEGDNSTSPGTLVDRNFYIVVYDVV